MANRYNFSSPGADINDAMERLMAQRRAEEHQALLDDIFKRNSESVMHDRDADRVLREKESTQRGQLAQQELEQRAQQHDYTRAKDIVTNAGADEVITPETAALLDKQGFGGRKDQRFVPGTPGIGVLAEDELPPDAKVGSEQTMLRPGLAYEQARAAEEARRGIAELNATERARMEAQRQADKTERNKETDAMKMQFHQDSMANSAASREAAAAARQAGIDAKADVATGKKDALAKEQQARRASALGIADSMRDAIKDVATIDPLSGQGTLKPGAAKIVGGSRWSPGLPAIMGGQGIIPGAIAEKLPGTKEADARAAVQQLIGQRVVELMREMKSQSRTGATGFGALSERELDLLQGASARLSTAQSDKAFTDALMDVNRLVDKIYVENGMDPAGAIGAAPSQQSPAATPAISTPRFKSRIESGTPDITAPSSRFRSRIE